MNELGNQAASAIAISYALEYLKHNPYFPLLRELDTVKWKKFIGFCAAFATTIGIHYAFDYNATGNGVITIVLPTYIELLHDVADLLKQWAFQQAAYDGFVKSDNITQANNVITEIKTELSKQ